MAKIRLLNIFFIISTFLIFFQTKGFCQQKTSLTYNSKYQIGKISDIESFKNLNEKEKFADSLFKSIDFVLDSIYKADTSKRLVDLSFKRDFINNRSRVYMNSYENNKITPIDSEFLLGLPTPCDCYIHNDSLTIKMGVGFFGGFGFNIQLSGSNFQSFFYNYIDDVKPYKLNLSDTTLENFIKVKSKYQSLIIDQKPTFKSGQQITGYFTFTSTNYFEQNGNKTFDSNYVNGKLFFTCKTRKKRDLDNFIR